jgi:hypothetical protein
MNAYQKAEDALKEAVKAALDDNIDPNLSTELWRHYQGVKSIASQVKQPESATFTVGDAPLGLEFYNQPVAADTINLDSVGQDVITFS